MDRFLEKFNLPRLHQEEIEIMNNPITSTEIEAVTKKSPKKQKPRTKQLHRRILSNIQTRNNACFSETLPPKNVEEGTLPDSFYKATITLIPKSAMENTKKENYRPISQVNTDSKTFNKILGDRIQQHIKSSCIMIKLGLFQGCKDSSIHTNQSM